MKYLKDFDLFLSTYIPSIDMVLLRREIPMAWGTTTDRLTPEINPFLYVRETKHLTLRGYRFLIPDS